MAGGDGSARSWRRALTPPLSRSQLTMSCWSLYIERFSDTLASKPTAAQELMQLRATRRGTHEAYERAGNAGMSGRPVDGVCPRGL